MGRRLVVLVAGMLVLAGCTDGEDAAVSADSEVGVLADGPVSEVTESMLEPSTFGEGELAASSAEEVGRILADLDAEGIDEGILVTFPDDVLFAFDSAEITPEGVVVLADMAEVITFYADARVQIRGHTDSRGAAEYNQRLSEQRAQAVARHLFERFGVDEARVTAHGFGQDHPVAPNEHPDGSDNPEGRAANRRVEVLVETADRGLLPDR